MNVLDKLSTFSYKNDISLFGLTNEFFAVVINKFFNSIEDGILIVAPSMFEAKKRKYPSSCGFEYFLFIYISFSTIIPSR